ncbi:MAG: type II toxin-antitoxin system RelE/ParE family toxin [Gemmatimonadota bacterium]
MRISPLAADQIRMAASWWIQHRDKAPDAFADDLERAVELIASLPAVGEPVPHPQVTGIRRLLLARVRYHLYYQHEADSDTVDVLALWHTGRGTGPPL